MTCFHHFTSQGEIQPAEIAVEKCSKPQLCYNGTTSNFDNTIQASWSISFWAGSATYVIFSNIQGNIESQELFFAVDEMQVACYKILNNLYTLGTGKNIFIERQCVLVVKCIVFEMVCILFHLISIHSFNLCYFNQLIEVVKQFC